MFSVYKLIFRKLILQVFEHVVGQAVIWGTCATGGTAEEKQQRFRKKENPEGIESVNKKWRVLPTLPEFAGTLETGSWTRGDPLQQLLCSAMGTAHRHLSPQRLCWKLQMPGVLCSCIVPGCSPSQDLPGHSCQDLPGHSCQPRAGVDHWMQGAGRGSCFHRAGGFAQGSGEVEFIYTSPKHLFSDLCSPFMSSVCMSLAIVWEPGFTVLLKSCPQNEIYF